MILRATVSALSTTFGEDAHPADLYVKLDQGRYVRLIVLERVDIAFRSRLDEFLVEFLSAKLVPARATAPWPVRVGSTTTRGRM
jgi:hypothetical protein